MIHLGKTKALIHDKSRKHYNLHPGQLKEILRHISIICEQKTSTYIHDRSQKHQGILCS
mgnify:CR=1 FL=1